MSSDHLEWRSTGSTERPISLTPRLSNSGFSLANAPSSVVQTGVKSLGCENSIAQLLPIQSWNLILPSVVSASKSGATAPIWSAMVLPHVFEVAMEFVETHCGKYTAWQSECEQTAAKGEILLLKLEPLALSFDPRPCDETSLRGRKTTDRPDIAAYDPHQAGPWGCYTGEPRRPSQRPIGNHL